MSIKLKKINDVEVKPIQKIIADTREIKGKDICSTCCTNMFLVAPTRSGKTCALFEVIKKCCGKKTKIVAFVSTLYNDDNWIQIKTWCKKKKISFTGHLSIYDGKTDLLQGYVDKFTKEAEEREKRNSIPIDPYESCIMFDNDDEDDEDEDKKYQYPSYIFIFDDLSTEIKAPSYNALLKQARHFGILTITSSQDLKDLLPASRNQILVWLLFRNLTEERLKTIYDAISCTIPFETFKKIYMYATKEKYNFLFVSHRDNDWRKNFNARFILPE